MIGHVAQLPRGIEDAVNLVKLTLEITDASVIEPLGRLPSLQTLRLHVSKDQQHGELDLRFPTDLFTKLQILEISCTSWLFSSSKLHVKFDEGAVEKLEQLKVHCSHSSDQIQISGLDHPVSLKQVWLVHALLEHALRKAVQQQLAKHPKIPAPKLETH